MTSLVSTIVGRLLELLISNICIHLQYVIVKYKVSQNMSWVFEDEWSNFDTKNKRETKYQRSIDNVNFVSGWL